MCERAWERALTEALTDDADAGSPALLLVEGAAGTGKSHLIEALLELPQARTVPRLAVRFRSSGALAVAEPPAAEHRAATACLALEAALNAVRPLLLVVEDVQHADDDSLRLLRGLLREPPQRFAAVLTYRPEQLPRRGLPLGGAANYPAQLSVLRYVPPPLDEAQVRALAGDVLGAERCPEEFVNRLLRDSAGVAQVLVDLLRMLRDADESRDHADVRDHFTAEDVDEAGVPVRLAEAVLDQLDALDAPHHPVVWAAAVLGEPAGVQDLTAVAGLGEEEGHRALVAALGCAALHETGQGRYGFAVPLAASAVYRVLPGPVRERLHHRAAALLAAREPAPWAAVARHWRGGGRTEDWLRAAERLAEGEAAVREDTAALALLEQALAEKGVPAERRGRLALTLARGAMLGVRSEGTAQALRGIVEDPALPRAVRGEIRLELGLLLHNRKRRFDEGRVELRRAAQELTERPALAARAMAALANPFFPGTSLEENLGWLRRAEEAAAASADDGAVTAVDACRATVLMNAGDPAAWPLVARLPRDATDRASRQQVARGLCNTANGAVYLGHYRRADELLDEGVALARNSGAPFLERVGRGTGLVRDWLAGRWAGLAERCTGLVAEDGIANDARVVLALLALAKGDWATAENWLPDDDPPASEVFEAPVAATAAGARIRLLMARQRTEAASAAATASWDWLRRKGVWVWAAGFAPWAVEAHVRAGHREPARAMVAEFAAGLDGRDAPWAEAALLWCRAVVAEADAEGAAVAHAVTVAGHAAGLDVGHAVGYSAGEAGAAGREPGHGAWEEAARLYRESSAAFARLPHPYAEALTAEGAGRCAVWRNRPQAEAAGGELARCVELLTGLGAAWDAARVRAVLRAHQPAAQRRRPGRPAYAERMSPREAEVAELAATGLTNREIAATLHLSPRTVEHHVARAIRKLGVDSRQALAEHHRVAGGGGEAAP
ncbi:helix-turn-helix transcriptional regulator [Streptomyces sp. RKND-216]|uniref:helix-turn-helix transcriptional regulator n=1 Tax=Streptomyces sp. RKND-216 TaxID=2562581 RepID=UPI00109DBB1A|nr:LuxR C-terminal-related transcriptional regulator [Streptomyces sp. RKND-216]THA25922.1 helix-turn-helix transcriptional regulator [Streptomyces sp. RKND-216]